MPMTSTWSSSTYGRNTAAVATCCRALFNMMRLGEGDVHDCDPAVSPETQEHGNSCNAVRLYVKFPSRN